MAHGIEMGIAGRKALICASSEGLGKACATALAQCGAQVTINGRNQAKLDAAAAEIKQATGASVEAVVADVTTPEGRAALLKRCPSPDILVNNAGGPPAGDFRTWTEEAWLKAVNANMLSMIHLTTAVINGMIERRWGRVISITSQSVKTVMPLLGLSTAARAGFTGFTASLAREVAQHGVTVNNLLPGAFETQRLRNLFATQAAARNVAPDVIKAERTASVPTKQIGDPADFGMWCAFLASTHARYMTGRNISLDGGAFSGVI